MLRKEFSLFHGVALVTLAALFLTGCAGGTETPATFTPVPEPPVVDLRLNPDISDALAGQTIVLSIETSGRNLNFKWTVTRGSLSALDTPTVIYTAPNTPGLDLVAVEVSSDSGTTTKSVSFNIIVPPTDVPTPTAVVTNTPLPPPLVEIFPQVGGGKEFVFINSGAELMNAFQPNQNCIHSGVYGLQLIYNMKNAANGGWGVQWSESAAKRFDASSFNLLSFWVKGASGGEVFQIGLKDTDGREVKIESKDLLIVTSGWLQVEIPLSKFAGVTTASVENVNLGFNKNHGSGSICLDDFAFVLRP